MGITVLALLPVRLMRPRRRAAPAPAVWEVWEAWDHSPGLFLIV
jgi:hypothetical protein